MRAVATSFEDCRRILGEIGNAELSAAGTHSAPRGLLSLTAPTMFGHLHVTPVVLDYLRCYPEADVNCWFVDRVVNLVDEGAEGASTWRCESRNCRTRPCRRFRSDACGACCAHCPRISPSTPDDLLEGHTIIANTDSSSPAEWRLHDGYKQILVRAHPRLTITTTNDSAIAAARGLRHRAAAVVSDRAVRKRRQSRHRAGQFRAAARADPSRASRRAPCDAEGARVSRPRRGDAARGTGAELSKRVSPCALNKSRPGGRCTFLRKSNGR